MLVARVAAPSGLDPRKETSCAVRGWRWFPPYS
jgi:hypothetical protein